MFLNQVPRRSDPADDLPGRLLVVFVAQAGADTRSGMRGKSRRNRVATYPNERPPQPRQLPLVAAAVPTHHQVQSQ